jgi:hypothetical protein
MTFPDGWTLAPSGWWYRAKRRDVEQARRHPDGRDSYFILCRPDEVQVPPCDRDLVAAIWPKGGPW